MSQFSSIPMALLKVLFMLHNFSQRTLRDLYRSNKKWVKWKMGKKVHSSIINNLTGHFCYWTHAIETIESLLLCSVCYCLSFFLLCDEFHIISLLKPNRICLHFPQLKHIFNKSTFLMFQKRTESSLTPKQQKNCLFFLGIESGDFNSLEVPISLMFSNLSLVL